jgi:hypothetical protein
MSKGRLEQTGSDVGCFTNTQLKRLLLLATSPADLLMAPGNPDQVGKLLSELQLPNKQSGEALLKRTMASDTPINDLSDIKDLSKQLIEECGDSPHSEAAKILYHLAVAAAYNRGFDISSRPISERLRTYLRLGLAFEESPLGDVFLRARAKIVNFPAQKIQ